MKQKILQKMIKREIYKTFTNLSNEELQLQYNKKNKFMSEMMS